MKSYSFISPTEVTLLVTGALFLSSPSGAQTVPAADQTKTESASETIELSPFEVVSTGDVGYLAQNTLAGSRLNTNLKDTAAAISVMTPEFLQDIGATNMRDVILFQNNAVPDVGDAAPNVNGNPLVGSPAWNLRIRGLPASYARNYFSWALSTDFYNVDRVDQSRGPNSILFGFGSPGGIVNATTKQAELAGRDTEITLLTGSWDRYRGTLDYNVVAIPKTLAFRLNLVADDGESWRRWESNQDRRAHLAGKWQVTDTSALKAEFEYGRVKDNVSRPWLMIDQTYSWRNAGKPTYDAAQWSAPASNIVTQTWSEHLVYTENTGTLMNWQGMPFSYSATQSWSHLSLTPENLAIVPLDTNAAGPDALRNTHYRTFTASYENRLTDAFAFEVAYNRQSSDFLGYDPDSGNLSRYSYLGGAAVLWADASNYLPTWTSNPNAGKYYLENNWTRRTNTLDLDTVRATGSYALDLGRAGKHRIAALLEHQQRDLYAAEESEVLVGNPFGGGAAFDSNRLFRRSYFTPGESATIRVPSWRTALVNVTDPVTGRSLSSGWAPNQAIDDTTSKQNTLMLAAQSTVLKDRLVTILGFRHDDVTYTDATGTEYRFKPNTFTAGAVVHLTSHVSAFVNGSDSRQLPNVSQTLITGGIPPMAESTGIDTGLKFDLGTRLYATASYYRTDVKNESEWGNIRSSMTSLNNRILERFVADGLLTAAQRDARLLDADAYLEDRLSKGYEFSIVANPTDAWRLTANFSITEVVKDNIMSEISTWADSATASWLATAASRGGANYLLGGGDWDTLGANIGWMRDGIAREQAFNGLPARGERKYGANLYTRYRFPTGVLKGLSFGGGTRYQSPNTIGMNGNDVIKGERLFLADGSVGYDFHTRLLGRKTWVELQVNVYNLFDNDDVQVYTTSWWDVTRAERVGLQEPRRVTVSAKFSF